MADALIELRPVPENLQLVEDIKDQITQVFRSYLYIPLVRELGLPMATIQNAKSTALMDAIAGGRITFSEGFFRGSLNSKITKELRALGAVWNRKVGAYFLPMAEMPTATVISVSGAMARYSAKIAGAEKKLATIQSAEIAGAVDVEKIFSSNLHEVEKQLKQSLPRDITVGQTLTAEQANRIATEWEENLRLDIKGWADTEILELRKTVHANVLAGNRYEALIETIQHSYGVTERKAHFLARQETNLVTAKFKELRYEEAGVYEYIWRNVVGSPKHPVRPSHKVLNGKIFRFDNPPITTEPGQPVRRCNPGEDYGCRCGAHPVIRVSK